MALTAHERDLFLSAMESGDLRALRAYFDQARGLHIADAAVVTVTGSGADTEINANFTELEAKVNMILAALEGAGVIEHS